MSRHLDKLLRRHEVGNIGVWNVFVQILLPLVFILSFVAVLQLKRYDRIIQETEVFAASLQTKIRKITETDKGSLTNEVERLVFITQRQKLQIALAELVAEDRKAWGLTGSHPGQVRIEDGQINDTAFREVCDALLNHFGSGGSKTRAAYISALYRRVLARTGLYDRHWSDDMEVPLWPASMQTDDPQLKQFEKFDPQSDRPDLAEFALTGISDAFIHPENRIFIHNHINGQAWETETLAVQLQAAVIERIYQWLIQNPSELEPVAQVLVRELAAPDTEAVRRRHLASRIHSETIASLRNKLTQKNYWLLSRTWTELGLID